MRTHSIGVVTCLLASLVSAQINTSAETIAYSSINATRGFYLQVPSAGLVVTHFEVPDTVGKGAYLVALYRLKAAPPVYARRVLVAPVFYADEIPSGTRVALKSPAVFSKGEWLAVLGAAHIPNNAKAQMTHSYGASGGVPTRVLGQQTTLYRCVMRVNLSKTKGVGELYAESLGPIARVRIHGVGIGAAFNYGTSSNGDARLLVDDTGAPNIGQTGRVVLWTNSINGDTGGLLVLSLKASNTRVPGIGLLLSHPYLFQFSTGGPVGWMKNFSFPIPNSNSLAGLELYWQGALTSPAGLHLTNGMQWTVGR